MKTRVITIHPQYPELDKIAQCAQIIRKGGLVIFPTETVYGIAADYANAQAMQRLRAVKKRPEGKPFSILVSQKGLISNYTPSGKTEIYKMIDAYWPGPLTIVVPSREGQDQTIGVRMPDHMIALRLVQESQRTIAAPSANFDSHPAPTNCDQALKYLDGLVELAIDGGPAKIGIGSSVVDLSGDKPRLLREGIITQADVDRVAQKKTVLFVCTGNSCRSVMAEYLLRNGLKGRADVEVLSAGTGVFIQSTASAETLSVLKDEGVDASKHLSRPVNTILLKKADLIFVMTRMHRQQVLERVPEVEHRVYLLKEFAATTDGSQLDMDIPDPIGKTHAEYKECIAIIKQAVNKILDLV